ncbi:Siderophore synthetase component [Paracoccus halophilus]|uniref:Siderophore synthetase component n=1 Tax=Paracoccus halophilus TaxID=376733 RepID=A0A1I0U866_9RHOB|nr:IucA/IucC family protein [Paracoccus halophilus]SFA60017.1 Siderophore synthetase component [Paracoccus halophilus]
MDALLARRVAETHSLQAVLNGVLREFDTGSTITRHGRHFCFLALGSDVLEIEVTYRSATGWHRFGQIRLCRDDVWRAAAFDDVLDFVIRLIYPEPASHLHCAALLDRMRSSCAGIAQALSERAPRSSGPAGSSAADPDDPFLAAEQAAVFGHFMHPAPKSRAGMTSAEAEIYMPEFGRGFALHYFLARLDAVREWSATDRLPSHLFSALADDMGIQLPDGYALLPAHPLQARYIRATGAADAWIADGRLVDLGRRGPAFFATSSVRSVYAPGLSYMLKFSIPVQLTNSWRVTRPHELVEGPMMAALASAWDLRAAEPNFHLVDDWASLAVRGLESDRGGFETIIRANPCQDSPSPLVQVAGLTADPRPGRPSLLARVIADTAASGAIGLPAAARLWFRCYLDHVVRPLIRFYSRFGIAFEAHQQNMLIALHNGLPVAGYFRDSQGYYIEESLCAAASQATALAASCRNLFYPADEIRTRFGYYLMANQVFGIVARLGVDGLLPERDTLAMIRDALQRTHDECGARGRAFIATLLADEIAVKANFQTRSDDLDELMVAGERAIYLRIPNPLASAGALHVAA